MQFSKDSQHKRRVTFVVSFLEVQQMLEVFNQKNDHIFFAFGQREDEQTLILVVALKTFA